PQVPCFFIFGDSLVDNGNNNDRETESKANYPPYGIDFPYGATGRFTNGRTIADLIGQMLGFQEFIPPFASAEGEEILRGVNYGSGGAGILDETGRKLGDVISLNEQLSNHEETISRIAQIVGDDGRAQQLLGSCIYTLIIGSNDYLLNYLDKFSTGEKPLEFATYLVSNFSDQLQKLYRFGARKVAVFALGGLGCVPEILTHYAASKCVENINTAAESYNENLRILVADLNRRFLDAKFVDIATNSTSLKVKIFPDRFRVADRPCCPVVGNACAAGSSPCEDRDDYVFWDAVHPSEAANLIIAGDAYQLMAPLYSPPID
ncbi:hypothetical protein M569_10182, partial [Genlisea aurea]